MREYYREYELTSSQSEAVALLESFFQSEVACFLLKGYAGTGKTFLIRGLVNYLQARNIPVVLSAPTGRAARVLAGKSGFRATTIHRFLYSGELLRDVDEWQGGQYDMFKVIYGTTGNPFPANAVFIADEASLISDAYADNDTLKFGTGHLLNDFVRYVFPARTANARKILFVGDPAQLPPVEMNFSPALDAEYLMKELGLESMSAELTGVVRQQAGSLILQHATALRQALADDRFNALALPAGLQQVVHVNSYSLVDEFLSCAGEAFEDALVIAHSNARVHVYNQSVRSRLFPGVPEPQPGDRLVVMSNNYLHGREILNGEMGTIVEINNHALHRHTVNIRRPKQTGADKAEKQVELVFREAVIQFQDLPAEHGAEPVQANIRCMILDNLLFSSKRELEYDETVALLVDFKNRFRQMGGKGDDFRSALRGDPFFNALRVKFGYAVTCHKAQGGEWRHVFVDCATSMGYNNRSYFRWLYTAITRASQRLLLINAPSFHSVSGMKAVVVPDMRDEDEQTEENTPVIEEEAGKPESPGGEDILPGLEMKLMDAGFTVSNKREINYGMQMQVAQDGETALLRIFYNKNNQITKSEIMNAGNAFAEKVAEALVNLGISPGVIRTSVPVSEATLSGSAKAGTNFIDDFEQRLLAVLQPAGISIIRKEMYDYQIIVYLERGLHYAAIKFYYNRKQQFTRFEMIQARSSGMNEELNSLIQKMTL